MERPTGVDHEIASVESKIKFIERLQIPEAFNIYAYRLLESGEVSSHFEVVAQKSDQLRQAFDTEIKFYDQHKGLGTSVSYVHEYRKSDTTPFKNVKNQKQGIKAYVATVNPDGSIEFSIQDRLYYPKLGQVIVLGTNSVYRVKNKDIAIPIDRSRPGFVNEGIASLFPHFNEVE